MPLPKIHLSGTKLKWYEMISESFNKYGIGRAAWSYREMNFGLTDDRLEGVRDKIIKLL